MAYTKKTWVSGETPLSAENMNHIEQGVAAAHNDISSLNTKIGNGINNTSYSGIISYPTEAGAYRVVNIVAGLPSTSVGYGTLTIINAGSYVAHIYIDTNNVLYWTRTIDFAKPTGWATVDASVVKGVSVKS